MPVRKIFILSSIVGVLVTRSIYADISIYADTPIMFTQVKADRSIRNFRLFLPADRVIESRIVLLHPDGNITVLTEGFAGARDVDVSFDGTTILFAGRQHVSDRWAIYEMTLKEESALDGSRLGQVIALPEDCLDPIYLTDGRILFSRFIKGAKLPEAALFSCRPDGSELQRLTFHPGIDLGVSLLQDGRVLFTNWRYNEKLGNWNARLFTINSDGTAVTAVREAMQATDGRQTQDSRIVCIAVDGSSPDGGGTLAAISMKSIRQKESLGDNAAGRFLSPFPLLNGDLFVAHIVDQLEATYGLYMLTPGGLSLLYDDPLWHDVDPVVVAARSLPMGHLSIINNTKATGVLYCLDTTFPDGDERPATIRVVSDPKRRPVGEALIEADGSFAIEVPADMPLSLELLNRDGDLVRPPSQWIWVRPNETRGCVGCHESRNLTPENRRPIALTKPPVPLTKKK